jgi:hypothetical protein
MISLIAFPLAGCDTLYLHNQSMSDKATKVTTAFNAVDISRMFNEQQAILDGFIKEEDAAVAAFVVARRDQQLARYIRSTSSVPPSESLIAGLAHEIKAQLDQTWGPQPRDTAVYDRLENLYDADSIARMFQADRDAIAKDLADRFRRRFPDDKREVGCDVLRKIATRPAGGDPREDSYRRVWDACRRVVQPLDANVPSDGLIGRTLSDLLRQEEAAAKARQDAEAARQSIKKLANANKAAKIPEDCAKLTDAPLAGSAEAELIELYCRSQKYLEQGSAAAKVAGWTEISEQLNTYLSAELREAAGEGATAEAAAEKTQKTRQAESILALLRATAAATDAFATEPRIRRVNATLMAIADAQQQRDEAQLRYDREQDLIAISRARLSALLRKAAHLATAERTIIGIRDAAGQPPRATGFTALRSANPGEPTLRMAAALAAYSRAWTNGDVPYDVLRFKEVQVERAHNVKLAAATGANFIAFLKPALNEIEAYYKGGIMPETIARALGYAGVISSISAK